jgi:hypothetical protein
MLGPTAINGIVQGRTRPECEKDYSIQPETRAASFSLMVLTFGLPHIIRRSLASHLPKYELA